MNRARYSAMLYLTICCRIYQSVHSLNNTSRNFLVEESTPPSVSFLLSSRHVHFRSHPFVTRGCGKVKARMDRIGFRTKGHQDPMKYTFA